MDIDPDKKLLILSVGELSSFVADSSVVSGGLSLPVRGKLGSAAHRSFQDQRKKNGPYREEVHVDVSLNDVSPGSNEWMIRVRGRLDGLIEEIDRTVVEEIKSVALSPNRFKAFSPSDHPRHQRQLEIYLYLLSILKPERLHVGNLVYINLLDGKKRSFEISFNHDEIESLISEVITTLIEREMRRSRERLEKQALSDHLEFPFPTRRSGQDKIIDEMINTLENSGDLLIEASTGLGKTAAVLFPVLRYALAEEKQVMFLTSKTTQQDLVFETAGQIRSNKTFPRILLLRARSKLCPQADLRCHPDECPYLEEFQHRIRENKVIESVLDKGLIHPDYLCEIGRDLTLCPHELQLAVCEDVDLIIGDYNYAFDPGCRLTALFEENDPSRLILIVDEAHNLPDRARGYYSAELKWSSVKDAYSKLEADAIRSFDSVIQAIQSQFEYYLSEAPDHTDPCPTQFSLSIWGKIVEDFEEAVIPYWYRLAHEEKRLDDDPVLILQRELDHFYRSLSFEGDNFIGLVRRNPAPSLEILCLDASPYLKETFSTVHASICISATLQPFNAYKSLIGLGDNSLTLPLENPFPPENCRILVDPTVTTLYREREENIKAIAERIERFYNLISGKTLAFFPSFEFMRRILDQVKIAEIFIQEENMSDVERADLLKAFNNRRSALLCSVMGGVFAEGIDLPGEMAEAAIIVGVGLPQVCTENQLIRAYFDRLDGNGFEVAYLYPGIRRVIQAVGRVIRSENDLGIILLLDRRYQNENYQNLFPGYWYEKHPEELICENWQNTVTDFVTTKRI